MNPKFSLGNLVATASVGHWMNTEEIAVDVGHCVFLHERGNWGEVDAEDAKANEDALIYGYRIMSVHTVANQKLWIITEADRSVTTLLFPEDY